MEGEKLSFNDDINFQEDLGQINSSKGEFVMKIPKQITNLIITMLYLFALSACGGGDSTSGTPAETPTQVIARLRASGILPTLDRSTSLAGPDLNNNGIRDDVDTWITNKNLALDITAAIKIDAAALQSALSVDTSNQQALVAVNNRMMAGITCTMSKFTSLVESDRILRDLESITVNTRERSAAYMAYNEALNGWVTKVPSVTEACDVQ